jgi:tRNA threonylcarbamoyladenosine biosynthesis protein TsaB
MNVLGFDTATPTTAVALLSDAGELHEASDQVPHDSRGQHAQRLLVLAADLLERAALGWRDVDLIAVGLGPGGYTGLRIGLATARGLALAHGSALAGVGTLRALAEPVSGATALALLDARRGELFVAAYMDDVEVLAPRVIAPTELAGLLPAATEPALLALGDGAIAQRQSLEHAGVAVPADDSPLHAVHGGSICRLAAAGHGTGELVPLYLRRPDAERALSALRR